MQGAGSLSPAPCLSAMWCPVVYQLGNHFLFQPGIPHSWAGVPFICHTAISVPRGALRGFSYFSFPKQHPPKICPLGKGRVLDRKFSFQTGHLLTPTQSHSDRDIHEWSLQKRGKRRRPCNSGRYKPLSAYVPLTWNNLRMSFSEKPSLHRGGSVRHSSALCCPMGGAKFANKFRNSIQTFSTCLLKTFHSFNKSN